MKLTLAKTWKECLRMWKQVDGEVEIHSELSVDELKEKHLKKIGLSRKLAWDCYFCEYNDLQGGNSGLGMDDDCSYCPAKLVSPRFRCDNITYCYYEKPRKFYQKLLQLNAKRKSKG